MFENLTDRLGQSLKGLAGQAFQRLAQAVREILEHDHQPPDFERSAALTAHAETTGRRL